MRTRSLLAIVSASTLVLFAAACGKKKSAGYSAPITITVGVKSNDVNGVDLTEIKNINTAPGNPFSAFTNAATQKLGHPPSSIELKHLTMSVGTAGTLTNLNEVWGGKVTVSFQMNSGNAIYPAGSFAMPAGTTYDGISTFDSTSMPASDYSQFTGDQFKMIVQGSAAPSFAGAGVNNGSLDVIFQFEAFK